ncbi:MAG: glycosyltransferase [Paludibacter sp.]|nr:glycosyltransferase [Paludibacter sp.]
MKNNITISVALCTFNGEQYIEDQLKSIVSQQLLPNEIVICDDQSQDNTVSIVNSFINRWNDKININLHINEKRLGVRANFQKAILLCNYDIIFLSDQDDIWHNNKTEKVISFFNEHPDIHVVFANANLVDNNNNIYSKTLFDAVNFKEEAQQLFAEGYAFELLNIDNRITGATMAFKRDFVAGNIDFRDYHDVLHDEALSLYAIKNNSLAFITECLMSYRIHETQAAGLSSRLESPPDINVFEYKPVKYWDKKTKELIPNEKLIILQNRDLFIKSYFGFFVILFNIALYKKNYNHYYKRIMKEDIRSFFRNHLKNIKKIFKKFI